MSINFKDLNPFRNPVSPLSPASLCSKTLRDPPGPPWVAEWGNQAGPPRGLSGDHPVPPAPRPPPSHRPPVSVAHSSSGHPPASWPSQRVCPLVGPRDIGPLPAPGGMCAAAHTRGAPPIRVHVPRGGPETPLYYYPSVTGISKVPIEVHTCLDDPRPQDGGSAWPEACNPGHSVQ